MSTLINTLTRRAARRAERRLEEAMPRSRFETSMMRSRMQESPSAGAAHGLGEEAMPFDEVWYRAPDEPLEKLDKVIALLASEDRWCKFFGLSGDGRRCLWGA